MKLLCWNCQGLGSPLTVQALKALVVKEKPDLVFLMETKNREEVVTKIQRSLKYHNSYIINPTCMSGGLALFWSSHININVEYANQNMIDTFCFENSKQILMKITCVYAPVNFHDRQLLWRALSQLSHINNLP